MFYWQGLRGWLRSSDPSAPNRVLYRAELHTVAQYSHMRYVLYWVFLLPHVCLTRFYILGSPLAYGLHEYHSSIQSGVGSIVHRTGIEPIYPD